MHLLQILCESLHFACVSYNIVPFMQAESIQSIDIIKGNIYGGNCGSTVLKLLCCKSEGRCFDSRWCRRYFSLT